MIVAVPIPVYGRHPLVKHTIQRLAKQEGVEARVICVGDKGDRAVCEQAGALFYEHPNVPLGAKWQFGITKARELNPDAVLYCGSSDWFSDNWCATLLKTGLPLVGKRDVHFLDLDKTGTIRGVYWPFYPMDNWRHKEAIGGGRLLRRAALDACDWRVFDPNLHNSLDWSMERNVGHTVPVEDGRLVSASISVWAWENKHKFAEMVRATHCLQLSAAHTQYIVETHFPELTRVFEHRDYRAAPTFPVPPSVQERKATIDAKLAAGTLRLAVPIPVRGRHQVLPHTIQRLFKQEGCATTVICMGDAEDREVCEAAGAVFVEVPNAPLAAKWQAGFTRARDFDPDVVMMLGSSDWVNHYWVRTLAGYYTGYPLLGKREVYYVDLQQNGQLRGVYWPHYPKESERYKEAIGGGRLLFREILDKVNWRAFAHLEWDNSMDWNTQLQLGRFQPHKDHTINLLDISSDAWENKHSFAELTKLPHCEPLDAAVLASFFEDWFPEIHQIFPAAVEYCPVPPVRGARSHQRRYRPTSVNKPPP